MANKKGSRQLQKRDRIRIEAFLQAGHSKAEIASMIGVHRSTIYNEIKRGMYEHLNSDYTTEMRYSADLAQQKYEENLKVRGTQLKIGNDIKLANYIEDKIINEDYSPAAVLGQLTAQGKWAEFDTKICTTTLYSYIDKGIFLKLSNKDLPVKANKKRQYKKVRKQQKRAEAGESIEKRPEEVESREEFGHWEMDSVIGQKWGELFKQVFKSITVDNGTEFALCEELERSAINEGEKRTKLYYCHPYSSWERGTNEVTNKMVRRKVPKGTNFDGKTEEEIQEVEDWINGYPRRIHGYRSAAEVFEEEIRKLA